MLGMGWEVVFEKSDGSGGECECWPQRSVGCYEVGEGGGRGCPMVRSSEHCRRNQGPRMKVLLEDRSHCWVDCRLSSLVEDCM